MLRFSRSIRWAQSLGVLPSNFLLDEGSWSTFIGMDFLFEISSRLVNDCVKLSFHRLEYTTSRAQMRSARKKLKKYS